MAFNGGGATPFFYKQNTTDKITSILEVLESVRINQCHQAAHSETQVRGTRQAHGSINVLAASRERLCQMPLKFLTGFLKFKFGSRVTPRCIHLVTMSILLPLVRISVFGLCIMGLGKPIFSSLHLQSYMIDRANV